MFHTLVRIDEEKYNMRQIADGKCYLKLAFDILLITVIITRMNAWPQSQISDTGEEKKGAEKFSKMIGGILRRRATHKNTSVL